MSEKPGDTYRRIVGLFHGILTGGTDPTWPVDAEDYLLERDGTVRAVLASYFELFLPRVAALRNRARTADLVRKIERRIRGAQAKGATPLVYLVGHSNGGVLVMQVAEALIERGHKIAGLQMMAPAVRAREASKKVSHWIVRGHLGKAMLVRCTADRTIGLVSKFRVVCWPWGALGLKGWDLSAMSPKSLPYVETLDVPVGHSVPLAPENRQRTFRTIMGPFVGVPQVTRKEAA